MWKWLNALRYPRQIIDSPKRGFAYSGGVSVYEDSAMQVSAFYRGVMYISSQIAKLPWNIKDSDNKTQKEDPLYYLLNLSPNKEMSSFAFRLCMTQNAIIHGNAYAEIERDLAGRPVAIWPIVSCNVEPYRTSEGVMVYKVVGGSNLVAGADVFLPAKDVFHLKNFHTKDGIVGQGLVAYAVGVLGISLGADRMAGNLFANGGLPSGVLEVPGTLSDEALARLKASWAESHAGKKSGGVSILEEGMKFSTVMMSPDILQFLESRKFNVLEIARFLGVPPTKLFDTDAATFNNMENANLEVATDTLDAWARNYEIEADIKLLNNQRGGRKSEMDLYQVFRGDMTTRANYFSKMMQTASLTPNEIREREGMPGYDGGDRFFLAVNNYSPIDRVDEIVDSQIKKSESGGASNPDPGQAALTKAATTFLEGK